MQSFLSILYFVLEIAHVADLILNFNNSLIFITFDAVSVYDR